MATTTEAARITVGEMLNVPTYTRHTVPMDPRVWITVVTDLTRLGLAALAYYTGKPDKNSELEDHQDTPARCCCCLH